MDYDEIQDLKKTLKLALLQLQEYSDNEFIIMEGEKINIQNKLNELKGD